MKLYVIANENNKSIYPLLKDACQKNSVEYSPIFENEFDFIEYPNTEGHMLYRASTSSLAKRIEQTIITNKTTTFHSAYNNSNVPHNASRHEAIFKKANIPTPKTIRDLPPSKNRLKNYVKHVGGFPVILKAFGGSHGVGVMKIDSFSSLISVSDYLQRDERKHLVLKEFIDTNGSARLIVVGNEVVDSIEYLNTKEDIRSNVGNSPRVRKKKFSDKVEEIAIKATHAIGSEFGGVDILIDQNKNPLVLEVNFPCNFARAQNTTNIDIADHMIKHLINKSKNI
ncbi:RimK family alpha-L-glutamate ligase [Patescibacteria group bacterium]